MGVGGCEGVFRRVFEGNLQICLHQLIFYFEGTLTETIGGFIWLFAVGMGVLRENHETLMSVLESFLHDPLVEWGRSKQRGSSSLDGRNTSFSLLIPVKSFVSFYWCNIQGQMVVVHQDETRSRNAKYTIKRIRDRLEGIYNMYGVLLSLDLEIVSRFARFIRILFLAYRALF